MVETLRKPTKAMQKVFSFYHRRRILRQKKILAKGKKCFANGARSTGDRLQRMTAAATELRRLGK
jgi:hypothetical protein